METISGIYLRVSTEDQHPENQIADLKKLADALHCKVFETYVDRESGQYSDRKEFQRMINDAEAGKFKILFIWALDRFSREGIKATLTHIERLKDVGVAIKSYQESWLDTSNEGIWQLLVAVMSWAAKEELKRFKERSMAGKRTMLNAGRLIGCTPPYGRKYIKRDREKGVDGRFERNEAEIEIINKIYKWYLELESIFLVAKRLYDMGIKARNGKFFHASTVRKILTSESNIGNFYYGKSRACEAKYHIHKVRKYKLSGRKKNPKSEYKLIKIEPIIDEAIFREVQNVIKKRGRKDMRIRQSKYEFLCQGLVRCIYCGRIYGTKIQNKHYQLYACPQRRFSNFNDPFCKARSISSRKLDGEVWNYVKGLIENEKLIKEKIKFSKDRREKDKVSNQKRCDILINEKSLIKNKKNKLFELYSETQISEATKQDIKNKLKDFEDREASLDNQILENKKKMTDFYNMEVLETEIERICNIYRGKLNNPDFELKRYITRRWVEEINILKDGSVVIKMKVPFELPDNIIKGEQNIHCIRRARKDNL
ncbi:MAG: hypothetical protein A2312_00435 [Candidatus Staskawiczbacteria bacterium RIFOXYB2_FULL_32_9]|uniref:Recombinase family protein n=1 Tax=Candidatus Staskawiczbacteria bacterium RIFOXYD1_FULL_32_13 TaxID=1802234 RepID=A0A1G2JKN3_9BACT|nr:MAG: Integrase [Parcubacteria group bacterium GW2011_GWC2_32_10]OGZ77573.1 MAG: hypothetical protein A2256_02320 [Candidatus Staskawiczbacteria bacterium RIFOXYA2_FULL_32_7]OGZ78274.1 MAG: hypothetical protein A2360_03850 [Candidatus Staskawiczbacteria bacterium RIFOXYB1_FULL_32_11]OGZ84560.1 MAG: hypothetical protein A2312_00435 [Candidatus Staskawiczbacteria bacterium RIFOXYB2_FULL_32_9]OGZ87706.1 MAG: hypothetical protein A2561_03370 [Candidatus Staskawiczbacteria bacterium RIFOXYD1_FULL_